jgi:hypothetical protein
MEIGDATGSAKAMFAIPALSNVMIRKNDFFSMRE